MDAIPNWVSNLSASALNGAILWYLVTQAIPKIVADFRAEIAAERAHCSEELTKADERAREMIALARGKDGASAT